MISQFMGTCGSPSACTGCKTVKNLVVMAVVSLPAIVLGQWIFSNPDCKDYRDNENVHALCQIGIEYPLIFVNLVLLLTMIIFWIASLIQGCCWLIG